VPRADAILAERYFRRLSDTIEPPPLMPRRMSADRIGDVAWRKVRAVLFGHPRFPSAPKKPYPFRRI
jgi:hypothetical protein